MKKTTDDNLFGQFSLKEWRNMLPELILITAIIYIGYSYHVDTKVIASATVMVSLLSGAFSWIVRLIGLALMVGSIVIKVLSISFIWLLNAVGYVISYITIKRGIAKMCRLIAD